VKGARRVKPAEKAKRVADPEVKRSAVVDELLTSVEEKLKQDVKVKATLGDYIRLIQLKKELEADEPRDIEVTWIEPETTKSDAGE
jgi:hypothetical protein